MQARRAWRDSKQALKQRAQYARAEIRQQALKSPSDFVSKLTRCAAEQMIHFVVNSTFEVGSVIDVLSEQLAVRAAPIVICHHIAAVA